MRQVFVANPKGGCGKTTMATQLASFYAQQGASVALVDHDRQRSSLDWLKVRPEKCAGIVPIAGFLGETVDMDYDYIIHDMPAGCGTDKLRVSVRSGDHLVVPMLPSPADIKAGVRFLMSINRDDELLASGVVIGLVANRVRANTNYAKVLAAFLKQVNMPLVATIRDTQNYIRAMDTGISVFDLPKSRVAADLEQWDPLLSWLN